MSLNSHNAQGSVCDWVYSRTLERFPKLKLAYAESQVGWMPFQYERMDGVWHEMSPTSDLPQPPSTYARGRVFGCIFDDLHGLRRRDEVGMEHILFECDFPHTERLVPEFPTPGVGALVEGRSRRARGVPTGARQRHSGLRAAAIRYREIDRRVTGTGTEAGLVQRRGRLEGKVAIVTGAGSTPGPGMATGRATAIVMAREGAQRSGGGHPGDRAEETRGEGREREEEGRGKRRRRGGGGRKKEEEGRGGRGEGERERRGGGRGGGGG